MIVKVDQEAFDAVKKLCDNALRTMGLGALKLVAGVHGNIILENQENGKAKETKENEPNNVQEKRIGETQS